MGVRFIFYCKDLDGNVVNNDIIQIGAVYLNRQLEIVDTFSELVKPQEEISDFITELTSISNDDVKYADAFDLVAEKFEKWVESHTNNIRSVRLAAWGTYFDIPLLRYDYKRYKRRYPFSGVAMDVKTLAIFWQSLSGHNSDQSSVGKVSMQMGIDIEGKQHDALVDAIAESKILQRIYADLDGGAFVKAQSNQYINVKIK